jgi:tetratricopeptide (TPR) repeat protein
MTDTPFPLAHGLRTKALLLIPLLVLAAYANTFTASWHMDDRPNILDNPAVQMTVWDMASLSRAVGIDQTQGRNMARPVANLSFALNWYLNGTNVAGYHLINLLIHIFNACLVYTLVILLGATPAFPDRYRARVHSIALGTGLLWALNPIQTQAVTYIVQRMTSLAALFYLAAVVAYLKLRLAAPVRQKLMWGIGAGGLFMLALGSKEYAATLPLAIVLIECLFFRKETDPFVNRNVAVMLVTGIVCTLVCVTVFFYWSDKDIVHLLTRSYEIRPFSLLERVLTQPRVLLFYLSLIFYPIPQRLSLEHDIPVSTALWQPWTTLPAILTVGILIACGFVCARKRPIWALAILWFFLNHAVESTFLPLEMVFEHRNYLPSVFLFLPLAVGWQDLKSRFQSRHHHVASVLQIASLLIPILLVAGTHARNLDWQSGRSLWMDTHRKAPGRARPVFNLAKDYERRGQYEQAIALYQKSMALRPPRLEHFEIMALTNIGTILYKSGRRRDAIAYYTKALDLLPETPKSHYNLAVVYVETGRFELATGHIEWLLAHNPDDMHALDLKGFLLLQQRRFRESLAVARRVLRLYPNSRSANLQIGAALTHVGNMDQGDWFFRRAQRKAPGDLLILLCRLENRLMAHDTSQADRITKTIFDRFPIAAISAMLSDSINEIGQPKVVAAYLQGHLERMGRRYRVP